MAFPSGKATHHGASRASRNGRKALAVLKDASILRAKIAAGWYRSELSHGIRRHRHDLPLREGDHVENDDVGQRHEHQDSKPGTESRLLEDEPEWNDQDDVGDDPKQDHRDEKHGQMARIEACGFIAPPCSRWAKAIAYVADQATCNVL